MKSPTGLALTDDTPTGVTLGDRVHECDVVFLTPQLRPRDEFLGELGCDCNELGLLRVDEFNRTSVPWIYAAGNSTDSRA